MLQKVSWLVLSGACLLRLAVAAPTQAGLSGVPGPLLEAENLGDPESVFDEISRRGAVLTVAWSPRGDVVAAGLSDGTIRLWETASGLESVRLRHKSPAEFVGFSPDGTTLVTAAGGHIKLWDLDTTAEIFLEGHDDRELFGTVAVFSPDGAQLATGKEQGDIDVYVKGGVSYRLKGHSRRVSDLAWSDDGRLLASASWDLSVRIWDMESGQRFKVLEGHQDIVNAVAWGGERALASGSSDGTIRLWDVENGLESQRFEGHSQAVSSIAWGGEGRLVASGSWDRMVRLWDPEIGIEVQRFGSHEGLINAVTWSPDGKTLASGSKDGTVRLWDVDSRREIRRLEGHIAPLSALAWSADGSLLVTASQDRMLRLWDVEQRLEAQRLDSRQSLVTSVALDEDGTLLAAGTLYGRISVWDLGPGEEKHRFVGHLGPISTVAWSHDRKKLASGSQDKSITIWDIDKRAVERHFERAHPGTVRTLAWHPDGRLASGSEDGTVRLWNPSSQSGTPRTLPLRGDSRPISALSWRSGEEALLVALTDRSLHRWDLRSGRRQQLEQLPDSVDLFALGMNGEFLATSESGDGIVRLWSRGATGYENFEILAGGQRSTWVACSMSGSCRRYDDGTLVVRRDSRGRLEPIPPQVGDDAAALEVAPAPRRLDAYVREATPLTLEIRNRGPGPAFWTRVRPVETGTEAPVVADCPSAHVVLEEERSTSLTCNVWVRGTYEDSGEPASLNFEVVGANAEPRQVGPIEVAGLGLMSRAPEVRWGEVRWFSKLKKLSLSFINSGNEPLGKARFILRFPETQQAISQVLESDTPPGDAAELRFDLPENLDLDRRTLVDVVAHTVDPPILKWSIYRQRVEMPRRLWLLPLAAIGFLAIFGFVSVYTDPLVRRLSRQPEALKQLPPQELRRAGWMLRAAGRLNSVLVAAGVQPSWFRGATAFYRGTDPATRCRLLAERLGVECDGPCGEDDAFGSLTLGPDFPLNLEECMLYLPPLNFSPATMLERMRACQKTKEEVTLILCGNAGQQDAVHRTGDQFSLWVAPSSGSIIELFLISEPFEALARLVAQQVPLTRISPYQTGGGVDKESVFFGRRQILNHIVNRAPANYLVAGGRQIGKTSLLKALQRWYRSSHPAVSCHFLVLSDEELVGRLAKTLSLPPDAKFDNILREVADLGSKRHIFLVDEADSFIRADRFRDYRTLNKVRTLSEEGRCNFIFAGFWDLYEAAVMDYSSPLKNFGEIVTISGLELDACRQLATKPMESMGIGYYSDGLVDRIIHKTGQRANLVSIVCNAIVRSLRSDDRLIREGDVAEALDGNAVEQALSGWVSLTSDRTQNALDRIVVYATVRKASFSLAETLQTLSDLGKDCQPQDVQRSLDRLMLAFVLAKKGQQYTYCVPLFQEMILSREPETLLEWELRELS